MTKLYTSKNILSTNDLEFCINLLYIIKSLYRSWELMWSECEAVNNRHTKNEQSRDPPCQPPHTIHPPEVFKTTTNWRRRTWDEGGWRSNPSEEKSSLWEVALLQGCRAKRKMSLIWRPLPDTENLSGQKSIPQTLPHVHHCSPPPLTQAAALQQLLHCLNHVAGHLFIYLLGSLSSLPQPIEAIAGIQPVVGVVVVTHSLPQTSPFLSVYFLFFGFSSISTRLVPLPSSVKQS